MKPSPIERDKSCAEYVRQDKSHKSVNMHRLADNPLEAKLLQRWRKMQGQSHTLEYIMSGPLNERAHLTERDMEVAATVIQWLGSPAGQYFVNEALDRS